MNIHYRNIIQGYSNFLLTEGNSPNMNQKDIDNVYEDLLTIIEILLSETPGPYIKKREYNKKLKHNILKLIFENEHQRTLWLLKYQDKFIQEFNQKFLVVE